jgi:uncharacterized protein (DUF952 family)
MITYHLVPKAYYESRDPDSPYEPWNFERDGFIHCTDGIDNVIQLANRNYKDHGFPWLLLVIEKTKVTAKTIYEDPERIYPHIYGPLNRDAIVDVAQTERGADGSFVSREAGE